MMGKIIILNGASSTGKSSIMQEFQNLSDDCWYSFSMDCFNGMLPQKYLNFDPSKKLTEENKKGFYFDDGGHVQLGEYAKNIGEDIIYTVKTLSDRGRNLVVDCVLFGLEDLKLFAKVLENNDVYVVRIHCSPEKLDERERNRGNRAVGSGRKQLERIDTEYNDLVLDSTEKSPKELAEELVNFVKSNEARALKDLINNSKKHPKACFSNQH